MNTRKSIGKFRIRIQYLNMRLNEESSSTNENSEIGNYLVQELLLNRLLSNGCISTQQTVEHRIMVYYGLHPAWQFVDQLYLDMSPKISSTPVHVARCQFAFNNSFPV